MLFDLRYSQTINNCKWWKLLDCNNNDNNNNNSQIILNSNINNMSKKNHNTNRNTNGKNSKSMRNRKKLFWIKHKQTLGNSKWILKLLLCIYFIYPGIGIMLQVVGHVLKLNVLDVKASTEAKVGDTYIIAGTGISVICLGVVVFKFPKNFVYDAWFIKQELKYYLIGFLAMFAITIIIFILYSSSIISRVMTHHLRFYCNLLSVRWLFHIVVDVCLPQSFSVVCTLHFVMQQMID